MCKHVCKPPNERAKDPISRELYVPMAKWQRLENARSHSESRQSVDGWPPSTLDVDGTFRTGSALVRHRWYECICSRLQFGTSFYYTYLSREWHLILRPPVIFIVLLLWSLVLLFFIFRCRELYIELFINRPCTAFTFVWRESAVFINVIF